MWGDLACITRIHSKLSMRRCFYQKILKQSAAKYSTKSSLVSVLDQFEAPISFAFAYGSGVFSQGPNTSNSSTQIDLILAVDSPTEWHRVNIKQHPSHYSSLKYLGPSAIHLVQNLGAGVYFNPLVRINSDLVKYGVVSTKTILADLNGWNTLYLAGRMQKPISVLKSQDSIKEGMDHNLISAISLALLMLPRDFTEKELFQKVAAISYMGDVRMMIAENPNKVRNIVDNQYMLFHKLYTGPAKECGVDLPPRLKPDELPDEDKVNLQQSMQFNDRQRLLDNLPNNIRQYLPQDLAENPKSRERVGIAVQKIVRGPALQQTVKGLLSAGLTKSVKYTLEKLQKRWR